MKYLGQEQQWLKAPTEGATKEGLQFEVGPWAGEAIEDGVAFSLPGKLEGAFIVSFSDFEELYKLARQARGLGQEHDRQKIIVQPVMTIDVGDRRDRGNSRSTGCFSQPDFAARYGRRRCLTSPL